MKRLLTLLLLAALGFGLLPGVVSAEEPGSISGNVIAEGTLLPVAGVYVEVLANSCDAYMGSGDTDADGEYMVGDLPTGTYKVAFYPGGLSPFVDEWWDDKPDCASADLVSVVEGADTPGIDAVLARDSVPPVVIVPDDVTVQATGPDGAVVEYPKAAAFDSDERVWEHLNFQFGDNRLVRNPGSYNEHVEYRRAVAYAVDKATVVEAIPGAALALDSYVEAWMPEWSQGAWAQYEYNPAMATYWLGQLCAKPGVDCVANPPKAVFTTTSNNSARVLLSELLIDMFAAAGIGYEAQLEDSSLFFGETLEFGNWDLGEWAWAGSVGDVPGLVWVHTPWDAESPPPDGQNFYRWGTPEVTGRDPAGYNQGPSSVIDAHTARFAQLVDLMRATTDEAELRLLVNEAENILADQLVFIPLYIRIDPRVVSGPTCAPASGSLFPVGVTTVTCTASDPAGNEGTASFTVTVVGFGMLRVTTSPAVPAQILVDGVPRDTWGLTWLKLPPGDYVVSFTDVPGFSTPAPRTVTVAEGQTTEVAGLFAERGWLRVITAPAVPATILVDGVPRNDWGMWTDLPAGSYEVCFGGVAGFVAPACQMAEVTAGLLTTITGTYS